MLQLRCLHEQAAELLATLDAQGRGTVVGRTDGHGYPYD